MEKLKFTFQATAVHICFYLFPFLEVRAGYFLQQSQATDLAKILVIRKYLVGAREEPWEVRVRNPIPSRR